MKWPPLPRFKGIRARVAGEKCPMCNDPGSGMWLDTKGMPYVGPTWIWVCTKCKESLTSPDPEV